MVSEVEARQGIEAPRAGVDALEKRLVPVDEIAQEELDELNRERREAKDEDYAL